MEMQSELVRMCIVAATESAAAVEKWRRQRRTLERMPSHLAEALLHRLLRRRLLFPSLLELFKYSVEEIDLKGQTCVDAEWMAYLGAFRFLRSLILADCNRITNSALWSISGMTSLKEVDLSRCSKVTDAGIRHLSSVPALEKLHISQTGVSADGIKNLASLTNLSKLDLGGLAVTDSALNSLQVLRRLQYLDIWGSKVSNEGAHLLKTFPSLSFLNLAWTSVTQLPTCSSLLCLNMSNCTIDHIFELNGPKARLEKLILSGATISDVLEAFRYVETNSLYFLDLSYTSLQTFSFLRSFNVLTHLNLRGSSVIDSALDCIAFIGENLKYLNLSNTKTSSDGIGVLAGNVSNLETLLLSGTAVNDTVIPYISMMPSLKFIELSSTNVKGLLHQANNVDEAVQSFSMLQNLGNLENLGLEGVNLEDVALSPLKNFSRLSHLNLRSSFLSDESLHLMSSIPNLINLGFFDAVLTNAGLNSFIPPPRLEVLDLSGCWLLTKDAILSFYQTHPQIEVRHEHVEIHAKRDIHHSYPSQVTKSPSHSKHKKGKLPTSPFKSGDIFLDQRMKYSREELLALQFPSAETSTPTHLDNMRPTI